MQHEGRDGQEPASNAIWGPVSWPKAIHDEIGNHGDVEKRGDSPEPAQEVVAYWRRFVFAASGPRHAERYRGGDVEQLDTPHTAYHHESQGPGLRRHRLRAMEGNDAEDSHTS